MCKSVVPAPVPARAALARVASQEGRFDRTSVDTAVRAAVEESGMLDVAVTPRVPASGGRAFLLVNHVMHRRDDEKELDFLAKVTDAEVIRAVAEIVAERLGGMTALTIGNAPLQGCDYARVIDDSGMRRVMDEWPPDARPALADLRGVVSRWSRTGAKVAEERRPLDDAVEVDLGDASLLEQLYLSGAEPHFRVGDYAGAETERFHGPGRHVYVINRRLLESQLIVSVPTLKTHQKVGLTCALKGTVGAVFLKQCLAHHRLGGPGSGGDEFSRDGWVRSAASRLAEHAAGLGTGVVPNAERIASKVLYRMVRQQPNVFMGGAWSGNDTAWRMTLDIARVLRFARVDGTMASTPQRDHVAVIDGLVAGEGEGPLRPTARREGVVIAGTDPLAADVMAALAMGWDPTALQLLRGAAQLGRYTISDVSNIDDVELFARGERFAAAEAPDLCGRPFMPPKGWDLDRLARRNEGVAGR